MNVNFLLIVGGFLVCIYQCCGTILRATEAPYVCEFARDLRRNPELRVQLWANAQKEIGIKPNYEELRKSDEITRFYGGFSFGFSAFIFNNTPVFYTRIWKNANSGIRTSFFCEQ